MQSGLRCVKPVLWITLIIVTAGGVYAATTSALPPLQGARTHSSDPLVESLGKAVSEGKEERTHELLLQVLQRPHLSSDFLLRVGIQLAQREFYEDAAQAFQRCIQEHPEVFEAYYNLALANIAQQRWEAALATLQQAPQQSKAEVLARSYLRGKVEESQGKASEAVQDLSEAFEGAPQNQAYAIDLGLFYVHERAYGQAANVFERALSLNSTSRFLLLGLSLSRFLDGQHEQSVLVLRKLLSRQPDFAPAQLLLTYSLYAEGKLAEAEKAAHQGLSAPHPSPYLYYLDASVLVKLQSRQYKRIFDELSTAEREMPSCSLCYLTQSKAHQAQGDSAAAITDLEIATQLDSRFPEAWYRLAALYRRVGRNEDASRAQNRFQSLEADKEGREIQMLRDNFLQSMDAAEAAQ